MANKLTNFFNRIFNRNTVKQEYKNDVKNTTANKNNVSFTKQEIKELTKLAKGSNKIRDRILKHEGGLLAILGGELSDKTVKQTYGLMGRESDFVLTKKSSDINRFRSKAEFERYITYLREVNKPNYLNNKIENYRNNFIQSLKNVYGNNADKLIAKLKTLSLPEYADLISRGDLFEISYLDSGYAPNMSDDFADFALRKMNEFLGL